MTLEQGLCRFQLVTESPLIARQQCQSRVEQTQLEIFAQEEDLTRRQQHRFVAIEALDAHQAADLAPGILEHFAPGAGRSAIHFRRSGRFLARPDIDRQRQRIDRRDDTFEAHAHAGQVDLRQRLQPVEIAGQRLAHPDELRPRGTGQAGIRRLQRQHGPLHIAGQLQLLGSQRHALFDLGHRPFVTAARQILIEVFERGLLALRLGQLAFQQA